MRFETDEEILDAIFGPPDPNTKKWKCPWLKCAHGMGLAGRGKCSYGDPLDKDCPGYMDEKEFLQDWKDSLN